jgi:hypothetical protein
VPAAAVRARPRAVYALVAALLNGSAVAPGADDAAGDTARADDGQLVFRSRDGPPGSAPRAWPAHFLGHVFERLWFAVFDVDYDPSEEVSDAA